MGTEAAKHIEIDVTGMICAAIAAQAEKARDELAQAFALPEETHQFYIDMATGAVKLRPWDKAICRAALYSFRYAAVGGAGNYGTIYIPFKGKTQCLKQAN